LATKRRRPKLFSDALAQILKGLHQIRVFEASMNSENRLVIDSALDIFESYPEHCELTIRFMV
jgi:hypothetical protein